MTEPYKIIHQTVPKNLVRQLEDAYFNRDAEALRRIAVNVELKLADLKRQVLELQAQLADRPCKE